MIEFGILNRLVADPTIAALIGANVTAVLLPEDTTYPAVTYQRASTVRDYDTSGAVSLSTIRLQVDSWSEDYVQVKQLDAAVRACLDGFSGTLPNGTYVDNTTVDSSYDLYESTARLHRVSTDFLITGVE